jgi:hypothetical protein
MGLRDISRKESGVGFCFAVLQWVLFIFGWPQLVKLYWPTYLQIKQEYDFSDSFYFMIVGVIEVSLIILFGNLIYFAFYKGNFAFIEKYKAVDEPWPWETNKEEWDKLFWRAVKLTVTNIWIAVPLA